MMTAPTAPARPIYEPHPKQMEALVLLGLHPEAAPPDGIPVNELLFGGQAGGGKGGRAPDRQRVGYNTDMETKVLTPKGFALIGDIRVGDQVCNPDGTVARVIAVHDRGDRQFYRLTFIDGATVEASDDHLWPYWIASQKKRRRTPRGETPTFTSPVEEWNWRYAQNCRLATTEQLHEVFHRAAAHATGGERPFWPIIPLTGAVNFTMAPGRWPIPPPYTLGVLLGDGSLGESSVQWSKPDPEIAAEVQQELEQTFPHLAVSTHASDAAVHGIVFADGPGSKQESMATLIARVGLTGKRSWEKFIPQQYKLAPAATRWALVQGLLDTDGYVDEDGGVYYSSSSETLTDDLQQLLWSLGFKATKTVKPEPTYTYEGQQRVGRPAYLLTIQGAHTDQLFRLPRKQQRCRPYNGGVSWSGRRLVSIEKTEIDHCLCITVDNPNGLYITDDFIVTHNSRLLRMVAVFVAQMWPGTRIAIFRKTTPELTQNHIFPLLRELAGHDIGTFNWTRKEFVLHNGSMIEFHHCEQETSYLDYHGFEWDTLLIDEATSLSEVTLTYLASRVRSTRASHRRMVVYASNPGGRSHSFMRRSFVDPGWGGAPFWSEMDEDGTRFRRAFLRSTLDDNPSLSRAEVMAGLRAIADPQLRAAMAEGRWDLTAGSFFTPFRHELHVIPPLWTVPPKDWRPWRAYDWGGKAPAACLWGVRDPTTPYPRTIVYREWTRAGLPTQRHAHNILYLSRQDPYIANTYGDPSCWQKKSGAIGATEAQEMATGGVPLVKANNRRPEGWARVLRALDAGDDGETPPELQIFDTCTGLITFLANAQQDPHRPEDIIQPKNDTDPRDDLGDTLRYLLMGAKPPPKPHQERTWGFRDTAQRLSPRERLRKLVHGDR